MFDIDFRGQFSPCCERGSGFQGAPTALSCVYTDDVCLGVVILTQVCSCVGENQ